MRAIIGGTVSEVTERSYTSNGQKQTVADVYIGSGRFFDKVSMPLDLVPTVGEDVQYLANIKAKSVVSSKSGERYTFLDIWCVERVADPVRLAAVS
jgi:hypothetical protein